MVVFMVARVVTMVVAMFVAMVMQFAVAITVAVSNSSVWNEVTGIFLNGFCVPIPLFAN